MRSIGRVTTWNEAKGFGFITPSGDGERVFFHVSAVARGSGRPKLHDRAEFSMSRDQRGRPRATHVWLATTSVPSARTASWIPLACTGVFFALVVRLIAVGALPSVVAMVYATASIVSFVAYWLDKAAARGDRWRTKEVTLHLFDLLCGWPGGLAAQRILGHKSRKLSFRIGFWLTVVVNCGALLWLASDTGRGFVDQMRAR